jgi:hypothetical protein
MGTLDSDEAEAASADPSDFVKSPDGRTVYYPNGPSFGGYVVPNAEREQVLRDAAERLRASNKGFFRYVFWALTFAFLAGWFLLLAQPSIEALCLLLAPPLLWILLDRCVFIWHMGRLVRGLERIQGDPKVARTGRHLAIGLAGGVALIWLVLHLYNERIAALPGNAGTINFYPDLSYSMVAAIFFGLLLWPAFRHHDDVVGSIGPKRTMLAYAFIGVLEFFIVAGMVWNFFDPTPRVIITRNFLLCGTRTRWSDVAAISLTVDERRLREYARLTLKSDEPSPPLGQFVPLLFRNGGPATICETTSLNSDSSKVYEKVETAWKQALSRTPDVSLIQSLDEIPIGSSREQVLAVLGEPAARTEGWAGRTHLYFVEPRSQAASESSTGNDRRVITIVLDGHQHVDRIASYRVQDGKIFDLVTNTAVRDEPDFSFIKYVLFGHQG